MSSLGMANDFLGDLERGQGCLVDRTNVIEFLRHLAKHHPDVVSKAGLIPKYKVVGVHLMQNLSANVRWAGKSKEERSAAMRALRAGKKPAPENDPRQVQPPTLVEILGSVTPAS